MLNIVSATFEITKISFTLQVTLIIMNKMHIWNVLFLSMQLFVTADWIPPISNRKDTKVSIVKSHKNSGIVYPTRRILNSHFVSFLVGRLQFVIGRLQNLFLGIFEIQGNPALTNALTGVGLGVATAGARFLGKN